MTIKQAISTVSGLVVLLTGFGVMNYMDSVEYDCSSVPEEVLTESFQHCAKVSSDPRVSMTLESCRDTVRRRYCE